MTQRGPNFRKALTLDLSFWETDAFLKARLAYLAYDEQDLPC